MASSHVRPREREVGLGPSATKALRAFLEAMFARRGASVEGAGALVLPPEERIDWVSAEIEDFVTRVSVRTYLVVVLTLFVANRIAPLFVKRLTPLASLDPVDRVHALERLEKSPLAPALLALKALACIHYYEHPDAARDVGFDGACLTGASAPVAAGASAPAVAGASLVAEEQ